MGPGKFGICFSYCKEGGIAGVGGPPPGGGAAPPPPPAAPAVAGEPSILIIALFWASCARPCAVVACTPGTAADGGMNLEMDWMALSTALCGSLPICMEGRAFCRISIAALTWLKPAAICPGFPVGTPMGEAPIGG